MSVADETKYSLEYYYQTMKYGTYIAAQPSEQSLDSIAALQKRIGIKNPVAREDLHTTVIYSRLGNPNVRPYEKTWTAQPVRLKLLGDEKNCLVLVLESEDLQYRHENLLQFGLTHSFDPYLPHITLSYDYDGESLDDEILFDENGESVVIIEFDSEYVEPLDE